MGEGPIKYQGSIEGFFFADSAQDVNTSIMVLNSPYYPDNKTLSFFAKIVYDIAEKTISLINKEEAARTWSEICNGTIKKVEEYHKYDETDKQYIKEWGNRIKGWKLLAWGKNPDDDYFGAAFWNRRERQVVISHRGTVQKWKNRKTWTTDIQGIVNLEYTKQIHSACTFSAIVTERCKIAMNHPISISFTGHSLGAWLAQITAFASKYLELFKNDSNHKMFQKKEQVSNDFWSHVHTVVFDSPGCYEMLCKISNDYYNKYEEEAYYFIAELDITIYFNTPNLVNCVNSHSAISRLIQIFETSDRSTNFLVLIPKEVSFFDLESHNMINFTRMLIRPEKTKTLTISDWPSYFFRRGNPTRTSDNRPLTFFRSPATLISFAVKAFRTIELEKNDNQLREFFRGKEYYNLIEDDKNGNIKLNYYAKEIDEKCHSVSVFTKKEYKFLEDWSKLRKEFSNVDNLNRLLEQEHLSTYESFLPKFEFVDENNKNLFICSTAENVIRLISRTKHIVNLFPKVFSVMEEDIEGIQDTIEVLLRERSEVYLNTLPKWTINFKDHFTDDLKLEYFLNPTGFPERNIPVNGNLLILVTDQDTKEQVFKIWNILEKLLRKDACYLSLTDLEELKQKRDIGKAFKDKDCHVNDILVVDCKIGVIEPFFVLNNLILIAKNEPDFFKKLIIVKSIDMIGPQSIEDEPVIQLTFSYGDLTEDSQNELLGKMIFYIYDKKINLKNIFNVTNPVELLQNQINYLSKSNVLVPLIETLNNQVSKIIQINSEYTVHNDDLKVLIYDILENMKIDKFSKRIESCNFGKSALVLISGDETRLNNHQNNLIFAPNKTEEDSLTMFHELCRKNSEKRIYRLHFSSDTYELKQIFDSDFYIERHLYHEILFKKENILELINRSCSSHSNIFIFCNDEQKSFSKIFKQNIPSIYFVLDNREAGGKSFDDKLVIVAENMVAALMVFGNIKKDPVHLVRVDGEKLIWTRSKGSIKDIYDHVYIGDSTLREIKCLGDKKDKALQYHDTKAMVIADESGMGKSTLLLKLAKHMDNHWVILVNLINFRKCLDEVPPEDRLNVDTIIDFLSISNSKLSMPLVKATLQYSLLNETSVPVVLFFDGYDEIANENIRMRFVSMFQYLKEKTNATLYITTKLWAKKILEEALFVFAVRIKGISWEEQNNFIKRFWTSRLCLEKNIDSFKQNLNDEVKTLFKRKDLFVFKHPISSHDQAQLENELNRQIEIISQKDLTSFPENQEALFREVQTFQGDRSALKKQVQICFENLSLLNSKLIDLFSFVWSLRKSENMFCQNYLKKHYLTESGCNSAKAEKIMKILLVSFEKIKDVEDTFNSDVLGIPLQLRMFARILQPHFNNERSLQFPKNVKSLLDLFQRFVTLKFQIYVEKFKKDIWRKSIAKILLEKHKCLAFQFLFPDQFQTILKTEEVFDLNRNSWNEIVIDVKNEEIFDLERNLWKEIIVDINHIGIIEIFFSGEYRFIHGAVAEFFATGKILDLLKESHLTTSLENLLLNNILLKDEHKMIRQFLNDQLAVDSDTENRFNFFGAKISKLIDGKNFTDFVNKKGETCLHVCVSENLAKLATLLLNSFNGFEKALSDFIDVKNNDLETATHYAAFNNQLELATLLINRKPRENIMHFKAVHIIEMEDLLPEENTTFDDVVVSFSERTMSIFFVRNNVVQKSSKYASDCYESYQILKLIKSFGNVENLSFSSLKTLFLFSKHINALDDMDEIVLKYAPDWVIYQEKRKSLRGRALPSNLLYLAASKGEYDIVNQLLVANVKINVVDEASGETPLLAAARACHWNIVELLINQNANVNIVDANSHSVLYYAAAYNQFDIVVLLLENGADMDVVEQINHSTTLKMAAYRGHWNIVEVLIKNGANVNQRHVESESTALHYAASAGKREIVLKLLEKNAVIDAIEDLNDYTPLTIAAKQEKWDVVKELIKHGANVDLPIRQGRKTVLQLALWYEQLDIASELINRTSKIDGYNDSTIQRPVIIAALKKYWRIFLKLIERGANIHTPDPRSGSTLLHYLAMDGQLGLIKRLLTMGADINAIDSVDHVTPIYVAAHCKHWDVVLMLIDNQADLNIPDKFFKTVLHLAAEMNESNVVKKLLEKGAEVNVRTIENVTPMCLAALAYNWDIVLELLKGNADPNIALTAGNQTVLYIAAHHGQLIVVKKLVEKGADKNATETTTNMTPIFAAAKNYQWMIVSELIDLGANVNIPNIDFETVLHMAALNGQLNIVKKLIVREANINAITKENQVTPVGMAASKNYWVVVNELINNGADVNIRITESKTTLLHIVAREGKTELVKLLLDKGAEINAVEEKFGCTPLIIAVENKCWDTAILLIQNEADLNVESVRETVYRFTALHFAALSDGLKVVKELVSHEELNIGDYENCFSETAANIAASRNHWEIVFELITHGANISKPDPITSKTLLHFAAENKELNIVEELLKRKDEIDINAREVSQRMTPVFIAALNSHWDVVKKLIKNGANVNIPDLRFRTVLYLASEKGELEIVDLLLSKRAVIDSIESVKKGTPIYIAALNKHWHVVKKLIEGEADLNILYGNNQISILYLAASSGQLEIVNALLDRNAEMDVIEKNDNLTPIYAAGLNEHWDVVKELIKRGARVNIPTKKDQKTIVNLAVDNSKDDIISEIDKVGANIFVES